MPETPSPRREDPDHPPSTVVRSPPVTVVAACADGSTPPLCTSLLFSSTGDLAAEALWREWPSPAVDRAVVRVHSEDAAVVASRVWRGRSRSGVPSVSASNDCQVDGDTVARHRLACATARGSLSLGLATEAFIRGVFGRRICWRPPPPMRLRPPAPTPLGGRRAAPGSTRVVCSSPPLCPTRSVPAPPRRCSPSSRRDACSAKVQTPLLTGVGGKDTCGVNGCRRARRPSPPHPHSGSGKALEWGSTPRAVAPAAPVHALLLPWMWAGAGAGHFLVRHGRWRCGTLTGVMWIGRGHGRGGWHGSHSWTGK